MPLPLDLWNFRPAKSSQINPKTHRIVAVCSVICLLWLVSENRHLIPSYYRHDARANVYSNLPILQQKVHTQNATEIKLSGRVLQMSRPLPPSLEKGSPRTFRWMFPQHINNQGNVPQVAGPVALWVQSGARPASHVYIRVTLALVRLKPWSHSTAHTLPWAVRSHKLTAFATSLSASHVVSGMQGTTDNQDRLSIRSIHT